MLTRTDLHAQACSDVAGYIGSSREAVTALWPDAVQQWGAYLGSGRYGRNTVDDLLMMDAIVTASLHSTRPPHRHDPN